MAPTGLLSAVLVLRTRQGDAVRTGRLIGDLEGVNNVTADPSREQVVVHYDPSKVESARLRESMRAASPAAAGSSLWIQWLPKLARALPAVASLV